MRGLLCLLLAACVLLFPARALHVSQLVVVYNADSELSEKSARRYAQLRDIPQTQLVGLSGLKSGHISREDFEKKIRQPLLEVGAQRGWRWPSGYTIGSSHPIYAMVLMPDMPLGILASPRPEGAPKLKPLEVDYAALDSELMTLGGRAPAAGLLANPCYGKEITLGLDHTSVMAVCRIDGPNAESINRMMEDPVRVERQGLWGWVVVDNRGSLKPEGDGDGWLVRIARQARVSGLPLFFETSPDTLAEAFPLMTDTAVYFGWYTHPANGPFHPNTPGDFRFAPGAVAIHLHSNSASSVKNAAFWAPALLNRGAAVTAGNVFEPYLGPSLHFDIFYDRLMKGGCVAEAALMASPVVSWQCIILGDPLYRPFAAMKKGSPDNVYGEWRRLRQKHGEDIPALHREVRLREKRAEGAALAEMYAWYCTEQKYLDEAAEFFATACGRYKELRDRTRTAIMAASVTAANGKRSRAEKLLRPWLDAGQNSPYLPALRKSYETITGKKLPEQK